MEAAKQLLASLEELAANETAPLRLDAGLYSASSLKAAAAAFVDCCSVLLEDTDSGYNLRVSVQPQQQVDRGRIVQEFLNFALCEAVHSLSGFGRHE